MNGEFQLHSYDHDEATLPSTPAPPAFGEAAPALASTSKDKKSTKKGKKTLT